MSPQQPYPYRPGGPGGQRQESGFRQGGGPSPRNDRQEEPSRLSQADLGRIVFEPLPPDIFSDIANNAAEVVSQTSKNKRTQIRKFYDELVMWNDRIQFRQSDSERNALYKESEPFIRMLKAKVTYAKGRDHVDETFLKLFSRCIDQITSVETLKRGKLFMEAFMGYYRVYGKD
ncbi:MAG: type III-A CRISPR-associated protein Csm2 [Methylobacteriaceae bacterium]|jgi:CRISPR-associated protein Csm2|nr:type III-A CRISPR-associated protein Csm2 [Methylobacteriaceae bacterium]